MQIFNIIIHIGANKNQPKWEYTWEENLLIGFCNSAMSGIYPIHPFQMATAPAAVIMTNPRRIPQSTLTIFFLIM